MTWTLFSEDVSSEQVVETCEDIERATQRATHYAEVAHGSPTLIGLSMGKQSTMAIVVGANGAQRSSMTMSMD
jgi:hypothetical protein